MIRRNSNSGVDPVRGGGSFGGGSGGDGMGPILGTVAIGTLFVFRTCVFKPSNTITETKIPDLPNYYPVSQRNLEYEPPQLDKYYETFPHPENHDVKAQIISYLQSESNIRMWITNSGDFIQILKEAPYVSECAVNELCINDTKAEFTIGCENGSVTFSTEDILVISSNVNGQRKELSIQELFGLARQDKKDEIQDCSAKPDVCFSFDKKLSAIKLSCNNTTISLGSEFSLVLSGKSKNGSMVEIPIL